MTEYFSGTDCTCAAYSEGECACGVDWTDPEVYILRSRVEFLESTEKALREHMDNREIVLYERIADLKKAEDYIAVLVEFIRNQETLEPEYQKILYDNLWDLYEE